LEKDRSKRYATAREFAQVLERIAPTLSDAQGAPPPLPSSAEITNEATRVAPKVAADAATLVSIAADAPTVSMKTPSHAVRKTLDRGADAVEEQAAVSQPRRRSPFAIAAIVILILLGAGWALVSREHPIEPGKPLPPPLQASAQVTSIASVTPGHLAINAFPWANVTRIRNLDSGRDVDAASSIVTPAPPIALPPGRYEITLSNPNFPAPITRTVNLSAGGEETLNVQFAEPSTAAMPDFGAGR
jgi:hypothetical protein